MTLIIEFAVGSALYIGVKAFQKRKKSLFQKHLKRNNDSNNLSSPLLFKDKRQQQQQEISPDIGQYETSKYEKEVERKFVLSLTSLGLSLGGMLIYSALNFISLPILVYLCFSFVQNGYKDLIAERRIGISTIDAVISIAVLALGYWFACAMYCVLFFFSQKVLLKTQNKSRQNLVDLLGEQPRSVCVIVNNVELEIPFDKLQLGDLVVISAGETVPIDGIVTHGIASIDQHSLTGESRPVEKSVSDTVFASSIVLSGKIYVRVEKAGKETIIGQISEVLNQTVSFKSSIEWRGEDIANRSALPTLILSAITMPVLGANSAVAVLCGYFGYNMRILSPLSILNFLRLTSQKGILVKDGSALESLTQVDTIIFDKTGTLTHGIPNVSTIHLCGEWSENELLRWAAAAEYKQKHPVAQAILHEAKIRELELPVLGNSAYEIGYGIRVMVDEHLVHVGSMNFMYMENISIPLAMADIETNCHEQGYSLVYVAVDEQLNGAIEIHPTIRPEAKNIVAAIRKRQMDTYIISGDQEKPTQRLAEELGIDHYFSDTLPKDKADIVEQLQQAGRKVCFIGDGINDSIALKKANVSISLNGASTIATDTAQIILMDESLSQLSYLFDLADSMDANMKRNLVASIMPGVIIIGGVLFLHFGIVAATLLYNSGLLVGVLNTMLPIWNQKNDQSLSS